MTATPVGLTPFPPRMPSLFSSKVVDTVKVVAVNDARESVPVVVEAAVVGVVPTAMWCSIPLLLVPPLVPGPSSRNDDDDDDASMVLLPHPLLVWVLAVPVPWPLR